jgi:E3 ubiquitin-protein ligase DOA10
LSFQAFEEYVSSKYANPDAIHHYEKVQSSGPTESIDYSHLIECNSTDVGAQSVSNREFEQREQDRISRIKLLNPAYLPMMIEEFERLMNE